MAEEIGSLAVGLSIDSANFEQSMKSIDRNLKAMGQEMRSVQAKGKEWGSSTDGLTTKQQALTRMLDGQGTKVERLRAAYEKSKAETGENSTATENLAIQLNRATAEYNKTETELNQVNAALKKQADDLKLSQSNWTKLGETMTDIGEKLKSVGDKMTSVGKSLSVGVTTPILAFGAAGLAAFNSVDEAIDTVITKTGATGEAAEELTENFRTVAKRVPDDLLSVGEAIGEVNTQFGFLGTELEDASQLMLQFANINGTDVTSASIASKQAIEAYGLANSDLTSVLDSVTKTAQDTGQAVDFLFDKATKGAPQIKALGLNFAEGTALIGSFEKAGVDSGAALSSLSKAQVIFAKDGKTLEEGLKGTIKSILGAKTETDALNIAAKVFGTKGGPRMVDAIKRGTFSLEEFTGAGANAAGAVVNTFNETVDPIDQAAIAMNNAKLAMAEVGEAVQVALLPFMEKATEVLGALADKFRSLSPETTQTIVVLAGIAAAIGPVLVVIGTLVSSIGAVLTAFGTVSAAIAVVTTGVASAVPGVSALAAIFTVLTGPIGLAIAAIVAVGAALVLAYNKVEWFRDGVNATWNKIKELTTVAFGAIKTTISTVIAAAVDFGKSQLDKFKVFWDQNGKQIVGILQSAFELLKKIVKSGMDFIKGVFEIVWPIIAGITKVAWGLIKTAVKNGIDLVLGVIQTVLKILQGDWKGAWETIKTTASTIWKNIEGFFKDVDLVQIGKDIIQGLIDGISSMVKAVGDAIKNVTDAITGTVKKILGIKSPSRVMKEIGKWTGQGLVDGILGTKSLVQKAIEELGGVILDVAENNVQKEKKLQQKANAEILKLRNDAASKIADLEKKSGNKILGIQESAVKKKKGMTAAQERNIVNSRSETAKKITKIEEETEAKIAKIKQKATKDSVELISKNQKEVLEEIKLFIDDKQSLEEMSLAQEAAIWEKSISLFEEGSKERVEAQKAFKKVTDEINKEVTTINENYLTKVESLNKQFIDEEKKLNDEYQKTLNDRARSLYTFAGIFDEIASREVSGTALLQNLKDQVSAFEDWQKNITSLAAKGIDDGLLAELREMGPKAGAEIAALNTLTDQQLQEYVSVWQVKNKQAREQAASELTDLKKNTEKQINELQIKTAEQLRIYQNEWRTSMIATKGAVKSEMAEMPNIGVYAISGLISGMLSKKSELESAAQTLADIVSSTFQSALDIHSPSRVFKGFGININEGLIEGIKQSYSKVQRTLSSAYGNLPNIKGLGQPLTSMNSPVSTNNNTHNVENHYHMTFNSPKALDPYESARLGKNAMKELYLQL